VNLVTGNLRAPLSERRNDLYETPAVAVEALLRVEQLPKRLWEPAAGRGAIVNVLRAAGHEVLASDLVDYGDPTHFARRDFLMEHKAPDGCQAIVTNPPYKNAAEFVAHALELCPLVMMLLPLKFFEAGIGTARKHLLRRKVLDEIPPARIHQFSGRLPMMHRDGWQGPKATSQVPYAWFVWNGAHTGPTIIDRISWTAEQAAAIRAMAREVERPTIEANQLELALTAAEVAP
jgi:hypothetical protein